MRTQHENVIAGNSPGILTRKLGPGRRNSKAGFNPGQRILVGSPAYESIPHLDRGPQSKLVAVGEAGMAAGCLDGRAIPVQRERLRAGDDAGQAHLMKFVSWSSWSNFLQITIAVCCKAPSVSLAVG
jgi:hypothetical protein